MNKFRQILASALMLCILPLAGLAQNGSNSSYSRFGLGTVADQSQTYNRGMGGVAIGMRDGARVNMQNPASYSGIDSLSFLMDVGMTFSYGHLSANGTSVNARNTTLTNVNAGFHVGKNIGMSIGFVPYTTIGYTFNTKTPVGKDEKTAQDISTQYTYTGSGGLHQLYIGAGWKPFANLSIGANVSYVWGSYDNSMAQTFYLGSSSSSDFSTEHQVYSADLHTYKIDFGVQYPVRLTHQDWLTIGATYGLGHSVGGEATMLRYTSTGDSTTTSTKNAFDLPHSFGGGLAWRHKNTLLVAADYTYTKWGDCELPVPQKQADGSYAYTAKKDQYMNSAKMAFGIEYTPDPTIKKYIKNIRYRAGFSYTSPYVKVNGKDGPKEYHATIGLGLPLSTRRLSGRSIINISAEWMQRKPSSTNMIKENYFLLNLGLSFNEKWFMKWKIE